MIIMIFIWAPDDTGIKKVGNDPKVPTMTHFVGGANVVAAQGLTVDKVGKLTATTFHQVEKVEQKVHSYDDAIEKPFLGHFDQDTHMNQMQPLPYIGINPIPANSPGSANDFTNVQAVWLIETELVVSVYNQTEFSEVPYLHPWKARHYGPIRTNFKFAKCNWALSSSRNRNGCIFFKFN